MTKWMTGPEISLEEMLSLREERAALQRELLAGLDKGCLVSLTLNMAGPVKRTPLSDLFFEEGRRRVAAVLEGLGLDWRETRMDRPAGLTACFSCSGQARQVKELLAGLEEAEPVCRLWDLDVLDRSGGKVSRGDLGLPERRCFLCGRPAAQCARSRTHSVEELRRHVDGLLWGWYVDTRARAVGAMAQRALLHEVAVTPKPGLVDRNNSGAHRDMDFFTFLDSACALGGYFAWCARWGLEHPELPPERALPRLRPAGMCAEADMKAATGGVNTHQGAIFSLGLLCAAAGRLLAGEGPRTPAELGRTAAAMAGQGTGCAGARREAAEGYARELAALEPLARDLADGLSWEQGLVNVLLRLLIGAEDTNLLRRGGADGLALVRRRAAELLERGGAAWEGAAELDRLLIGENLSPGGCADLLAVVCFLWFWGERGGAGA